MNVLFSIKLNKQGGGHENETKNAKPRRTDSQSSYIIYIILDAGRDVIGGAGGAGGGICPPLNLKTSDFFVFLHTTLCFFHIFFIFFII